MEWMHSQLSGTKMYDAETLNRCASGFREICSCFEQRIYHDDAYDVYNRCVTAVQKYAAIYYHTRYLMSGREQ